jgi:hypothetical protein
LSRGIRHVRIFDLVLFLNNLANLDGLGGQNVKGIRRDIPRTFRRALNQVGRVINSNLELTGIVVCKEVFLLL